MPSSDLGGAAVLVTRPARQAERLCRRIEEAGGRPVRFPVVEIAPPADPDAAASVVDRLGDCAIALFVSANAVERGLELVRERLGALPEGLRLAAVGRATARALEAELGRPPDLVPEGRFDSEGLLALPALQEVSGRRIAIFRGEGGRELLARTLTERGAQVDYVEVYRRRRPEADVEALLRTWETEGIDAVTVTSNEGLENLIALLGDRGLEHLRRTPLVAMSRRTAELAAERGIEAPVRVAPEASDAGIVAALCEGRLGKAEGR